MDLVGIAEIAEIANVSRQAVSNWLARDASFPKPVASLACGEIFARRDVVAWLTASRRLPDLAPSSAERRFKVGVFYSHADINDAFGGNPNAYLRIRAGRVSCGCFNAQLNPNAPQEILVGTGPQIERSVDILMEQGGVIPVFVKRGTNQWQYSGLMRPIRLERNPDVVARKARDGGQKNISAVLSMKLADER